MSEVIELLKRSDDYLLGRIHEKASFVELEELVRLRLANKLTTHKTIQPFK